MVVKERLEDKEAGKAVTLAFNFQYYIMKSVLTRGSPAARYVSGRLARQPGLLILVLMLMRRARQTKAQFLLLFHHPFELAIGQTALVC
jgi:hypothetical protein